MLGKIKQFVLRNHYNINGGIIERGRVNLEYWQKSTNIGDTLAPVICDWMLAQRGLRPDAKVKKTRHLLTVGSILAERRIPCDAVVWGTGIHYFSAVSKIAFWRKLRKLDIRAVRGPVTKTILACNGYKCPDIFGDPAILMPRIYVPEGVKKVSGRTTLIRHFLSADLKAPADVEPLDTRTDDYRAFIDAICASEKVISSSLHGIILAESYGVPTVFLQENMSEQLIKFYDWYYSTGRTNIRFAYSVEEAMAMEPMPLPELERMRDGLMESFPYDLWNN